MTPRSISPAGQAKILKTQRRVLEALTALTVSEMPKKITITAVCVEAGISPDALALSHHSDLKAKIERTIVEHNATHFGKSRKRANPASDVAMSRIARLEQELSEIRERYDSAVQSIRLLALSLDDALTEIDRLRQHKQTMHPAPVTVIGRGTS